MGLLWFSVLFGHAQAVVRCGGISTATAAISANPRIWPELFPRLGEYSHIPIRILHLLKRTTSFRGTITVLASKTPTFPILTLMLQKLACGI